MSKLVKEKKIASNRYDDVKDKKNKKYIEWVLSLLQGGISLRKIEESFSDKLDIDSINKLYNHILKSSIRYRNRSITIFSDLNKIPKKTIAEILGTERKTIRSYINIFKAGGVDELFDFSRKEIKKHDEPKYIENVFKILHSPPSCYGSSSRCPFQPSADGRLGIMVS